MTTSLDPASAIGFALPKGATDCHVHVFDPVRFSYSPSRRYTPPPATMSDLIAFHAALGIERVVVVQPSVYGTDNSCLCDALKRLGSRARGVAVIDPKASAAELDDLGAAGVCGVRLNLEVGRNRDATAAIDLFERTALQVEGHHLIVQVNAALSVIATLAPSIMQSPVPVLLDHFAHAKAKLGTGQEGFHSLLALLQAKKVFVKLSGPYQISELEPGYHDISPIAQALISAAPAQIVWGSDWPHTSGAGRPANYRPTDIEPFRNEDGGKNLGLLDTWVPDHTVRRNILVDNADRLYQFC